jgi:hypothetical protein
MRTNQCSRRARERFRYDTFGARPSETTRSSASAIRRTRAMTIKDVLIAHARRDETDPARDHALSMARAYGAHLTAAAYATSPRLRRRSSRKWNCLARLLWWWTAAGFRIFLGGRHAVDAQQMCVPVLMAHRKTPAGSPSNERANITPSCVECIAFAAWKHRSSELSLKNAYALRSFEGHCVAPTLACSPGLTISKRALASLLYMPHLTQNMHSNDN